jgi:hypothetical protein
VPAARSVTKLSALPGGDPPRVLPLTDRVSLIVASVPSEFYSSEAIESRLADLDWVTKAGTAHHAVPDTLVEKHTVIPFRLFTLFSSDEKAVSTLARRARAIESALERVAGKAEWVLKVSKPSKGLSAVARTASSRAEVEASSGTSFLQKKAAAKQAAVETATRVRKTAAATYETLADLAYDATLRDVDPGAGLLLDASFLVPTRQVAAVKRALSKTAAALLDAGCRVSFTGPWPPYSFVSLERTPRG